MTLKTTEMTQTTENVTLTQLKKELKAAQLNVKLGEAAVIIIDAFDNKERFTYEVELCGRDNLNHALYTGFDNDHFMSCGRLTMKVRTVKHFEDIYKIWYDKKSGLTDELMRALRLYEKHLDNGSQYILVQTVKNQVR